MTEPLPPRVADLTGYDLLLSLARLGSIGAAARAHGISQPAASARIRRLEAQLGVPLVERTARGSNLTARGGLVVDWARPVIAAAADLEAGIAALRDEHDTHLRVAASLTVAEYLLPGWLLRLRARHPGTAVALVSANSSGVIEAVQSGSVELGFVEGRSVPSGLRSRTVARDELVLVVAPGHPWARRRGVEGARLAATALVTRERGSGTREVLAGALRAGGVDALAEPLLELSSTTAIKSSVAAGAGPAVLSARTVAGELQAGTLVRVPVAGVDLTRPLRAIWPAGQTPRGPARDLLAIAERER
ncbi:LysR family transcriptional regulator [Sciscionella marina]|uniref:LysR family transcriptional regulator n=1 Tax=Sciscionella marina TaxID=508770 RepID=UPI00058F8BD6|nr:LysR family transcriptional regulator [Sciscionella marina]